MRAEIPADWIDRPMVADCREACAELPDSSIDMIFTDPPYNAHDLYAWLGKEAPRLLKDGAWCYVYTGNLFVMDVAPMLAAGGLEFRGISALLGSGGFVRQWRMVGVWKPILMFTKGPMRDTPYRLNLFSSGRDKRYHRWGQGASPAFNSIRMCTESGELVLDPFCGGGTTAMVCRSLGRRFLTFDTDPEAIETTRSRLVWEDLPLFAGRAP